ncbi:MerR family transcriptional regulator [Solibacillus sp. FSL H8-0523]|uniref:MerR family transcriptional regulator n=1 Tax=Solibacillus sp. FSL H8-0523 TaxID=2954511 RepID=UPI003100E04E
MKYWSTGEVSKQRNISNRTLRYYDQIKLLTPSYKDDYGKRYYSEEDLFKLEKILILKSLSMPLEDIQHLLDQLSYKQILISHYNHLQRQLTELETSISNTSTLINLVSLEETLSWEKLVELIDQSKQSEKKWMDFFNDDEKVHLENNLPNLSENDYLTAQYINLIKKIESCITLTIPPESVEGYQIAMNLTALSKETFQGDAQLENKFWEIRKLPSEETGLFPISNEVLEFVERSMDFFSKNKD